MISHQDDIFALCIENKDCDDLETKKIYRIIPDETASREGFVRIIDESEEDYLYPESYFVRIELPEKARAAFSAESGR